MEATLEISQQEFFIKTSLRLPAQSQATDLAQPFLDYPHPRYLSSSNPTQAATSQVISYHYSFKHATPSTAASLAWGGIHDCLITVPEAFNRNYMSVPISS